MSSKEEKSKRSKDKKCNYFIFFIFNIKAIQVQIKRFFFMSKYDKVIIKLVFYRHFYERVEC